MADQREELELTLVSSVHSYSSSCGYCGRGRDGSDEEELHGGPSVRLGMVAERLTAQQYEILMERGGTRGAERSTGWPAVC